MSTIITYVQQEKRTFAQLPFNVVDSLVLSQLIYLNFKSVVPSLAEQSEPILLKNIFNYGSLNHLINAEVRDIPQNTQLLQALMTSPRFHHLGLNYYQEKIDDQKEEQFTAITYFLDPQTTYLAFSGTGASFIGWKENFNMSFIEPIPSQEDGLAYVRHVLDTLPSATNFFLGGHSKGGNVAVYAGMHLSPSLKSRLLQIYSHDGPGFKTAVFSSPPFLSIKDKINKTVAQSSVVGMLLAQHEAYQVVKSNRFGLMQHDPFSWLVKNTDFIYAPNHSASALSLGQALNQWIGNLTDDKRALFIDTLYQVIKANQSKNCNELTANWYKETVTILKQMQSLDPATRNFILKTIKALIKLSVKNFCQIPLKSSN